MKRLPILLAAALAVGCAVQKPVVDEAVAPALLEQEPVQQNRVSDVTMSDVNS